MQDDTCVAHANTNEWLLNFNLQPILIYVYVNKYIANWKDSHFLNAFLNLDE